MNLYFKILKSKKKRKTKKQIIKNEFKKEIDEKFDENINENDHESKMLALSMLKDDIGIYQKPEYGIFSYKTLMTLKKNNFLKRSSTLKVNKKLLRKINSNKIRDEIFNQSQKVNHLRNNFLNYVNQYKSRRNLVKKTIIDFDSIKETMFEDILRKDYLTSFRKRIQNFRNIIEYDNEKVRFILFTF